eukprot:CAMPEP_0180699974 /NCGR_PEP_ID=MMETSP1038_2-20121128/4827_1 /TAXON_ID=632150 /ORGANISM="Azadinium spinosum, Strain 3D9" /LENGTH=497 /DNA_ID=CAMNT_0022731613 /DNA_START=30 /DNA_END=1525 /DNA_ORIENTATION=+
MPPGAPGTTGSSIQLYGLSQWLLLRPLRRLLCAAFDRFLNSWQDVANSLQWAFDFNGGLKPVTPAHNLPLTVKSGKIPADFVGAYLRVGPNAQYWPPNRRTHVFDGDGMVHSIRISNGAATYHCQYLETPRYVFERLWGMEWFPRIGEFCGKAGLAKMMTTHPAKMRLSGVPAHEQSPANTAISFTPDGKLWALHETGGPFRFRLDEAGLPRSIGYDNLGGTLKCPISAHPKFDQRTNECFFHGRIIMKEFYMGCIADGRLTDRVNLDMPIGFHHDMFITENYAVIVDGSMQMNPMNILKGGALWDFNPAVKLRFGKDDEDAFIWVESEEAADIVHTLYAYDEGDEIVLWAPLTHYREDDPHAKVGVLGNNGAFQMRRIVINLAQKSVRVQEVPGAEKYETEFPRIRDDRLGMRVRYGYTAMQQTCNGDPNIGDDDRGYLGLILWNQRTQESTFAVYDAKTFLPTPIVELSIPRRVPIGFHAAWITEEQFQQQLHAI